MRIHHLAVIGAALTLAACASSRLPTDPVSYSQAEAADSVRINVGQTVIVEGIRVRFSAVENDSRCPIDAICVWEGDAVANFAVEQSSGSPASVLKLHTTLEPKSGVAYGVRVELLRLAPYPSASSPIRQDAYWAWIRITAAG